MLAPVTKWVARVERAAAFDDVFAHALRVATTGRPGPVALEIPEDVFTSRRPRDPKIAGADAAFPRFRPALARGDVERVGAPLLAGAERPVLLAGGGVLASPSRRRAARIRRGDGDPRATTIMGKGAIDERHELSLGVVGTFGCVRANAGSSRPMPYSSSAASWISFDDRLSDAAPRSAAGAHRHRRRGDRPRDAGRGGRGRGRPRGADWLSAEHVSARDASARPLVLRLCRLNGRREPAQTTALLRTPSWRRSARLPGRGDAGLRCFVGLGLGGAVLPGAAGRVVPCPARPGRHRLVRRRRYRRQRGGRGSGDCAGGRWRLGIHDGRGRDRSARAAFRSRTSS